MKAIKRCAPRQSGPLASLLILMLLGGCTQSLMNAVLMNKPYVMALLEIADSRYKVEINGVMINRGAQSVTVEIPVNQWQRSGENKISLFVYA